MNSGLIGLYITVILGFVTVIGFLKSHMDTRFDAVNQRFDDMRNLWLAELHRVEEIIDARLKHLEER
jgi:hypothetical protein